jgi:AcrR family transcriptional regulator
MFTVSTYYCSRITCEDFMPRHPDPLLEGRILEAAHKLFMKGGEKALSMRALAKLAHTNTPAVYRRFRNRKAILRALLEGVQQDLFLALQPCSSIQEICQRTLEFALAHPRDYVLAFSEWAPKFQESRPNVEYAKSRAAEWLGGSPEDYSSLVLGLWALIHGTAMLLISKTLHAKYQAELHSVFTASVELLVTNASTYR